MNPSYFRLLAGAVFAALLVLACTSDTEEKAARLAQADIFREADDRTSEIPELRAALKLDPTDAQVNLLLAEAHGALGNNEQAFFYFGEAYRLDPSLTRAAMAQLPVLAATDLEAAQALLEELLEKEPENARLRVRQSEMALLEADTDAALQYALTAAEMDPTDGLAHRMLGTVYQAMIRENELRNQPTPASVRESAIKAFDVASQHESEKDLAARWQDHRAKALVYGGWEGHEAETKVALDEAWQAAKEAEATGGMRQIAQEALDLGVRFRDTELVRWAIERRVEVAPNDFDAYANLAGLLNREDPGSGDAVWQDLLAERGDELGPHVAYVRYLSGRGEQDKAIEHWENAPESVASLPAARAQVVGLYLVTRQSDKAREAFARMEEEHPDAIATRLYRARFAMRDGRSEDGLRQLRALAEVAEQPNVLFELAQAEFTANNLGAALSATDRAIELLGGAGAGILRLRLRIQQVDRDWMAVLGTYREMRQSRMPIAPTDELARIRALYETQRSDVGRRALERLLESPEAPLGAVLMFARYEGGRDLERARTMLEAAAANVRDESLLVALVSLDVKAGETARALERIDAFGNVTARTQLIRARLLAQSGRVQEAVDLANELFERKPRPAGSGRLLVQLLSAQGEREKAIEKLEAEREAGTLDASQLWILGHLRLLRGELDQSREPLEAALRKDPSMLEAKNDLAFVLAELKTDLDRALELARSAKAQAPSVAEVSDTLGWVYYHRGLYDPAVVEFRSAIEQAQAAGDDQADLHYHLGMALKGAGRDQDANAAFDAALALDPNHANARSARGVAAAGSG